MKKYFIIGLLAIMLVLPVCAKAQTTSTEDIMASLRQQMTNLLQQIDKMQEELGRLRGEVVKVEEQLEKLTKHLQLGSKDKEVTILQEFLKQDPDIYPEGMVTGYYGPLTEKAVKKFQEKNGIEAIGIVGPKTLAKINEVIEEKQIISTPTQKPISTTPVCIQVITPAKNPSTGECVDFATPCEVKAGWEKVSSCTISAQPPTTLKPGTSPSTVGTGTRKFRPIDPSRCPGIIETSCTIEPANIIKVSVYDEKGVHIDTRENNNSGMAGFLNLPYGNYTVVINAEGFEYYKASFTVCATCEEITTIYLKKISTPLASPSITVLDPNGGNKYLKGSTYTTTWGSTGVNTVYIKLRKGSDTYPGPEGMISDVILNSGSYQWTVPATLPDGNDYWFVVLDGTYGGPMDSSDAPFSIVTTVSQNQATGTLDQMANVLNSIKSMLEKMIKSF